MIDLRCEKCRRRGCLVQYESLMPDKTVTLCERCWELMKTSIRRSGLPAPNVRRIFYDPKTETTYRF